MNWVNLPTFFFCLLAPIIALGKLATPQINEPASSQLIASITCPNHAGTVVEVSRHACRKDNRFCRLQLKLKDQKGPQISGLTSMVLPVPAGKIEKETDSKWSLHPVEPPTPDAVSSGLANLQVRTLKLGKSIGGILVDSTMVGQGSGLPATAYELFSCNKTEIKSIWSGGDNGSDALSEVQIKDEGGQDVIRIRGGAFDAAGLALRPGDVATVKWKDSSKRVILEKSVK